MSRLNDLENKHSGLWVDVNELENKLIRTIEKFGDRLGNIETKLKQLECKHGDIIFDPGGLRCEPVVNGVEVYFQPSQKCGWCKKVLKTYWFEKDKPEFEKDKREYEKEWAFKIIGENRAIIETIEAEEKKKK